ncbi:MAG: hypothetical protein R3351_05065 [Nitrospirales bacterium]|nr:hypothetical protein [Nitrospirales bacterium]
MIKPILAILLGGLLLLGFSPAFAEEPQLSDEQILQAWNQAPANVKPLAEAAPSTGAEGLQILSDEDLDKINAAGLADLGSIAGQKAIWLGCTLLCEPLGGVKSTLLEQKSGVKSSLLGVKGTLLGLKPNGQDPS